MTIKIVKSQYADTSAPSGAVNKDVLLANSKLHISDVSAAMRWMANQLEIAGDLHDWTKIKFIDEFYRDFEDNRKNENWFKSIHLQERHHLTDRCPDDVNLFDVLERIADITMAGMARSGKTYDDDLSPALLTRAYKNTIELLKKNIEVVE